MAPPTPPNLLVNVNNFEVKEEGVGWTFDEDLNKFKCPIESCKGGPYKYQNHLRTHMQFKHNLFMEWPIIGHPQKPHNILQVIDHHKYNAIVMGDEIWKKQKELKKLKRDGKRKPNVNGILTQSPMSYANLEKPLLAKFIKHKLSQLLGIFEWGRVIDLTCFKKLDNNDQLYQFLGTTYGYWGI
jgi:hypothetical protein